jgi:4-diphosphocytidyl-2-C-methyl-D-erythritol kinase
VTLAARAPGKVNLSLCVGAPRMDGLHPLVSVVQAVSLADELTLAPGGEADVVVCPGVEGENLALRALREFRAATGWAGPPQTLTIAKRIPVAAGMGGGSADAAAALRLAAAAAGTEIPAELPMRLGADVPALLRLGRVLMAGAGERVAPLPAPDAPFALVIVPLDAALSTPAVYRAFDILGVARADAELAELEAALRAGEPSAPVNDLQAAAIRLCPAIPPALEALARAGATDVMVSGSGPTVFGRLPERAAAEAAAERLRSGGYPRAAAAVPVDPDYGAVRRLAASQ